MDTARTILPPPTAAPFSAPVAIPAGAGEHAQLGGFGINWKIDGLHSDQRFSVVHHPLAPRALAAPLHRHHREDEFSFVISGTLGAMLGDDVISAGPGSWIFKPRGQWHTFWNASDSPCEIIEVISPAGFEKYFRELAAVWPDMAKAAAIREKYALDVDIASVPDLIARFGLVAGAPSAAQGT
jgi:mannose-6-phosphate isomerase-like protein (cupin superfamily)